MSRISVASLCCGLAGLLVPLVNIVAIVLGIVGLCQIGRDPRLRGRPYATVGICLGAVGVLLSIMIGFLVFSATIAVRQAMAVRSPAMRAVQQQCIAFSTAHDRYPTHVAELLTKPGAGALHEAVVGGLPIETVGYVTLGDYDFMDFDESSEARDAVADAVAADAALDLADPSCYRFGDYVFVRLRNATSDARIVFAWEADWTNNGRVVFFDDGGSHRVPRALWDETWDDDAGARRKLGLPAFTETPQ
jgi:hypothetical protein